MSYLSKFNSIIRAKWPLKKLIARSATLLLAAFFLKACATTELSTVINPAYRHKPISTVIVEARNIGLKERKLIEESVTTALASQKIRAWQAIDIWPPIKKYKMREIYQIAKKKRTDAILILSVKNYNKNAHKPKSVTVITQSTEKNSLWWEFPRAKQTTRYPEEPARLVFNIKLYDTKNGNIIWLAEGETSSSFAKNFSHLSRNLGEETVKMLAQDHIIRAANRAK